MKVGKSDTAQSQSVSVIGRLEKGGAVAIGLRADVISEKRQLRGLHIFRVLQFLQDDLHLVTPTRSYTQD